MISNIPAPTVIESQITQSTTFDLDKYATKELLFAKLEVVNTRIDNVPELIDSKLSKLELSLSKERSSNTRWQITTYISLAATIAAIIAIFIH